MIDLFINIRHSNVTTIRYIYPASAELSGTSLVSVPPTARIHDCGGLMIALKFLTPNIPRLETENVPPWK